MASSRKYHPDLIPEDSSAAEREKIEALSSEINSAYRKLRNIFTRVDTLLQEIEEQKPEEFQLKNYVKLPVELSMEYFEIQEFLEDEAGKAEAHSKLQRFIKGVEQSQKELKDSLLKTLEGHSSSLEETDSPSVWQVPQDFLSEVAKLVGALRYTDRILIDIKKFQ